MGENVYSLASTRTTLVLPLGATEFILCMCQHKHFIPFLSHKRQQGFVQSSNFPHKPYHACPFALISNFTNNLIMLSSVAPYTNDKCNEKVCKSLERYAHEKYLRLNRNSFLWLACFYSLRGENKLHYVSRKDTLLQSNVVDCFQFNFTQH